MPKAEHEEFVYVLTNYFDFFPAASCLPSFFLPLLPTPAPGCKEYFFLWCSQFPFKNTFLNPCILRSISPHYLIAFITLLLKLKQLQWLSKKNPNPQTHSFIWKVGRHPRWILWMSKTQICHWVLLMATYILFSAFVHYVQPVEKCVYFFSKRDNGEILDIPGE